jgi:uncharacterized protein
MQLPAPIEFIWDIANKYKNLEKHTVNVDEIEQVFFDEQKKTFLDVIHSEKEVRYRVVGKTKENRLLFVVFTVRGNKIRVISARDLNKKEYSLYEKRT